MMRYRSLRTLGHGVDGPVEEVLADRLGAAPLARRPVAVPAGTPRRRLREASEALARLGHPAIATVADVVDVDDERIQVVRTLGADGTLADRLAAGTFTPEEAVALVATLTDALRAAHGAGVAHGHVCASNVLLADGAALLADFGVAAARAGDDPADLFARDRHDLAELAARIRARVEVAPPAPLPHWRHHPGRPAVTPPPVAGAVATLRPHDRALAGALAFGVGSVMGVTFVLVEALTGRA